MIAYVHGDFFDLLVTFLVIRSQPLRIVKFNFLASDIHSTKPHVQSGPPFETEVYKALSAAVRQGTFVEVMATTNQRAKNVVDQTDESHQKHSDYKSEHGSRVKLPSAPVLGV